jgi:hypothetical protein
MRLKAVSVLQLMVTGSCKTVQRLIRQAQAEKDLQRVEELRDYETRLEKTGSKAAQALAGAVKETLRKAMSEQEEAGKLTLCEQITKVSVCRALMICGRIRVQVLPLP